MRSILATIVFVVITIILSILSVFTAIIDRSGKWYSVLARFWSRAFCFLYNIQIKVIGKNNIRKSEHYVFAVNHSSYVDIPVVFVSIKKDIRLILKHTLTKIPIWGWALLISPFIIINRSNAVQSKRSLAKAIERIQSGESVLIFPEGTRTTTGKLQTFKRGAFHLAFASGAKVIPVAIVGTFDILPRTKNMPEIGRKVTVKIGEAIEASTDIENIREKEIDLMNRTHEAIEQLLAG